MSRCLSSSMGVLSTMSGGQRRNTKKNRRGGQEQRSEGGIGGKEKGRRGRLSIKTGREGTPGRSDYVLPNSA